MGGKRVESDVFLPLAETLYFDLLVHDHSASALIQVGYGRPQSSNPPVRLGRDWLYILTADNVE